MIVVAAAIAYGLHLLGLSGTWIGIVVAVMVGMGIMGGVAQTRRPERSG
jgi:hypothetical protein